MQSILPKHSKKWNLLGNFVAVLTLAYFLGCLFLLLQQRQLIYRPNAKLAMLPNNPAFKLTYKDVWMPIPNSPAKLHGWWIPASSQAKVTLPNEPVQILTSPKVMLYFCGVGRNMGDRNYLSRVAAFQQLGFSVLVFDYRGYGSSKGAFPNELQVYEDSQAAWHYLRYQQQIPPEQIVIYGESLGGAIALDLAIRHPEAGGLIMQSSFTSMSKVIESRKPLQIFPIDLLLTEKFDSLAKMRSLKIPVLFIHGRADSVVPFAMSQQLYNIASKPKQLLLISGADHVRIYQPGQSYLKAIQKFVELME